MFIISHIFLVIFSVTFFAAEHQAQSLFPNKFFISASQPTDTFQNLLTHLEVPYKSQTLSDIVDATQKHWIRPNNTERWNLPQTAADQKTIELFKELALADGIEPQNKSFDCAVIFGANAQTMRKRLAYLLYLHNEKNIRFKEIVFLVSDRKRDPVIESEAILKNESNRHLVNKKKIGCYAQKIPNNETEIAQMIWNQSKLGALGKLPVTFVHTQSQIMDDGSVKRPTTFDTVQTFQNLYPLKKDSLILAISSQPHIFRQHLIIETGLKGYNIETVGPRKKNLKHHLSLDTIARDLYTLKATEDKNSKL